MRPTPPTPPEQFAVGAADRSEELYQRADAIVAEAERSPLQYLDRCERWPDLLDRLVSTAERLAEECFYDGALGPGTAMLDPAPYIERIRTAYGFVTATMRLPAAVPARLRAAIAVARAASLGYIVVRAPNRFAEGRAITTAAAEQLLALVDEKGADPETLHIELLVDDAPDRDKWVGHALPRCDAEGSVLRVDGPPAFHRCVARALEHNVD